MFGAALKEVLRHANNLFVRINGDQTINDRKTFTGTVEIKSTDAGAGEGPVFELYRDSASPAVNDVLGLIKFFGKDSGGNKTGYGSVYTLITDPTNGAHDSLLGFQTMVAGIFESRFSIGQGLYYSAGSDPGAGKINVTGINLSGNASGPAAAADQEATTSQYLWVTPAVQNRHPSAVKAFSSFVGTGTVSTVSAYNVSSVNDNGTGDYTINFTTAFSSTNYAASAIGIASGSTIGVVGVMTLGTSTCRILTGTVGSGGTVLSDIDYVSVAFYGDQ